MANAGNIIQVTEATFEFDVIQASFQRPVVVDFWAPWCGPCRTLGPILEQLAVEPAHNFILAKVNVDENPNLSGRYRVQSIPAVKAFYHGEVVAEFTGALPAPQVREFIRKIAPSEVDKVLGEAQGLLVARDWADAETAFRRVLLDYPDTGPAMVGLARALLAQGKGCEAREYLSRRLEGKIFTQVELLRPLAAYLCWTETTAPDDDTAVIEIQYRQAARLITRGNFAAAMDGLLEVLRQDKHYRNREVQKVMLGLFELLGEGDQLTQDYWREMASILF